ncbi:uncharacterized protein glob1 [Penaeus vannamei]|uniref:uncharacterized protein glob1 n=1 Tax=Penaeus vannamei TaxID=6689 RepID=UPI00387F6269
MGNSYTREDSVDSGGRSGSSRRSSFLRRYNKSFKSRDSESLRGYSEDEATDSDRERPLEGDLGRRLTKQRTIEAALGGADEERKEAEQKRVEEDEESEEPPEELTEEQKETVKRTWKIIEESVAKVGVVLFMGLFETHPDVQEVFIPFRGLPMEEVQQSKELRAHALRVMGFMEKAVRRLDQPDKLVPLIQECGRNHCRYGAQVQHVELVGPEFIRAIRPALEGEWTPEVEMAWALLLQNIAYVMKEAMKEAIREGVKS